MSVTRAHLALRSGLTGSVSLREPMARHTTYRIGGPADLFVTCDTIHDLALTYRVLGEEGIEYVVLGKGSNILVADEGYRGAVIVLGRDFKRHGLEGGHLKAGAGCVLAVLVQDAFSHGVSGLEFAVGIPGTVGGALAMNAGGRQEWIGDVVESVTLYLPGEGLLALRGPEVTWGYRSTDLPERGAVVECALRVEDGDRSAIRRTMESSFARRKATQPIGRPSAGSVFVNPPGDSAGRMIERAGLKGVRVGGAVVSETHANFIINDGSASAADVVALIHRVRDTVKEMHGIELETEIRFLGSFDQP